MLLFRSRRRLLCSFLLAWLALGWARATSVLIIYGRGELFVGTDGGWTRHSLSGTGAPVPHCKLEQYGAVFVAHAGGAYLTAHDAKGKLAVVLDIRPIVEAAMQTTGGLDAKANALDLSFWRSYQRVVHEVASWPASAIRDELVNQLGLEEFAVVGIGEDGKPRAVVLGYYEDFDAGSGPTRTRTETPSDDPNRLTPIAFALGYSEVKDGLRLTDSTDIPLTIKDYLMEETELHPSAVIPPYTIVKVSTTGVSVINAGSCPYAPMKKLVKGSAP
jgi:hypothetical protein